MMKYEWRKNEKCYYSVKEQPSMITMPSQNYIAIEGKGNPNQDDFQQRVSVLYSLAYQVKMKYKTQYANDTESFKQSKFSDYTVFPLEGIWTSSSPDPLDKDSFLYTIMIKQPEFITSGLFESGMETVKKKKPHPLLEEAFFLTCEGGEYVQILHKGPFEEEPRSFSKMNEFIQEKGRKRCKQYHREIYLTDARKTVPENKKTILRYEIL